MKPSDAYLRLVEWSEEDQCYVGRSPGLFLGGVHGDDEVQVYQDLVCAIEDWVESAEREGFNPPPLPARHIPASSTCGSARSCTNC